MSTIPQIPDNAPFSAEQRAWLNGYLAGLFSKGNSAPAESTPSLGSILFLYGSQTGSAEGLAKRFGKEAKKLGYESRVLGLELFSSLNLVEEKRVALITSTYGDGEMPDNAQSFWEYLQAESAPRLDHLEYSVLALGDTNYTLFCEAGKLIDQRLENLGAKRIFPRKDCETDYDKPAAEWFQGLLQTWGGAASLPSSVEQEPQKEESSFGKSNPFPALLKTNRLLNGAGSSKETRHFEIHLEGSGLTYEVGDALGVLPSNCPDFVSEILEASGLTAEEIVKSPEGKEMPLREALIQKFDLKPFLGELPSKGIQATDLVAPLRKLQPRLYSISSSPKTHPGEVHLTVGIVRYELHGRQRKGACSTFLAERIQGESTVPVFIHKSPSFRLPSDLSKPVIMVGPGTGIAPFRAFLEERRATGATGKNWLFFGDQRESTDFLYREELLAMKEEGHLTHLHLAFSRDQQEKIYVQNRMLEHALDLWAWLQEGASFYVCGDASRMAKDVDAALHHIAETAGGLSPENATLYVKQLKTDKRYLRDVY
jgi:sulfite reductase (NADPH) flavoprotein alpha-component